MFNVLVRFPPHLLPYDEMSPVVGPSKRKHHPPALNSTTADTTDGKRVKFKPNVATVAQRPKTLDADENLTSNALENAPLAPRGAKRKRVQPTQSVTGLSRNRRKVERPAAPVINHLPTVKLNVYGFSTGDNAELGLGPEPKLHDTMRFTVTELAAQLFIWYG